MSEGGRNTAETKIRARLQMELGANDEVPISVLKEFFYEHEAQVKADVERVAWDTAPSARMRPGLPNSCSVDAIRPPDPERTHSIPPKELMP